MALYSAAKYGLRGLGALPRQCLVSIEHTRVFSAAPPPPQGKAGGKGPSQPAAGAKGAPQPAAGGKGAPQPMATAKPAEPAQPAQPEINLGRFTAEKEDIVITVFKKFQTAYRGLMDGLKEIPLPLSGDDAAVRKFVQKVDALKKKVDYPDGERLMNAELNFKQKCARGDMRRFLASAVEDREMSKMGEEVVARISQALDEAEKETGPLVSTNKKAGELLGKKFKVIMDEYGLGKVTREEARFQMYKKQIRSLREKVEADIDTVKRREGLEWVKIDPATLRLKW